MSALLLALALAAPGPDDYGLALRAVDAGTGVAIGARARITAAGQPAMDTDVPEGGEALAVSAASVDVSVQAGGYRPLSAVFQLERGAVLRVTFEMDAAAPLPTARARAAPPAALLHGYVVEAGTARPVAGADVTLPQLDRRTVTDESGYFRFTLEAPPASAPPLLTTLRITAAGHAPHEVTGLLIAPGATLLREDVSRGEQPTTRDDRPQALRAADASGASGGKAALPEEQPTTTTGPAALVALDPPAVIRLGTSCTCSTCAAVSILSLETYVKRGLNDEWIASWSGHSLRAGAVAYRAYGAWYAAHPISGTYDICSTTCCQVNDADTSSGTDAAVDRTAGYMLERGAGVFRAEYSAENNAWDDPGDGLTCSNADLSCGDGSAGSPAAGWSCLADGVDATHGCFGHGRGACQWGTQRWSQQGRLWSWILDHYYNDHGAGTGLRTAHLSTPLVLLQAGAPARVASGARFTITARASNRASLTHSHVLLGASLRSAATVVSDPAHDTVAVLPPGDSDLSRAFDVRLSVRPGIYDLLVSLYDDVDEDGTIANGIDLPLQLLELPAAVTVCGGPFCVPRPER